MGVVAAASVVTMIDGDYYTELRLARVIYIQAQPAVTRLQSFSVCKYLKNALEMTSLVAFVLKTTRVNTDQTEHAIN